MKNIYKLGVMGAILLGGCSTNMTPTNPIQVVQNPKVATPDAPIHTAAVAKRLNDCIVRTNQSAEALLVDSQIIVVTRNNQHAKALFSSPDKLNDEQAHALTKYLEEANTCRPVAIEGLNPEVIQIYQEFFKKLDGVYADLISRKITIGVANQERQLLIQDARMKRMATQGKKS